MGSSPKLVILGQDQEGGRSEITAAQASKVVLVPCKALKHVWICDGRLQIHGSHDTSTVCLHNIALAGQSPENLRFQM